MEEKQDRSSLQTWVGLLISLACLAAIFLLIDPREIWAALKAADIRILWAPVVGIILFLALRAVRWRFLLNNIVPYNKVFHIQNIGYLLTNVLPLRLGEVARAVLIGSEPPATISQGISTMVVERVLDMLFMVTLLPFALAAVGQVPEELRSSFQIIGAITVVAVVVLIVAANQRNWARRISEKVFDRIAFMDTATWTRRVDDLLKGLNSLTRLKDGIVLALMSIVVWLPIIAAYWLTMLAVGIEPTLAEVCFVICLAAFGIAAPSSPSQAGVYHLVVIFALTFAGHPEEQAASFAFIYHGITVVTLVIMGGLGLLFTRSTFGHVIETTRKFMSGRKEGLELADHSE